LHGAASRLRQDSKQRCIRAVVPPSHGSFTGASACEVERAPSAAITRLANAPDVMPRPRIPAGQFAWVQVKRNHPTLQEIGAIRVVVGNAVQLTGRDAQITRDPRDLVVAAVLQIVNVGTGALSIAQAASNSGEQRRALPRNRPEHGSHLWLANITGDADGMH